MPQTKKQTIKPVPVSEPETGVDTSGSLIDSIIDAAQVGGLDISSIDALSQSAQNREQIYEYYDSMATDDIISSVLDVYVDDTIQTNDKGQVVWAESADSKVLDYVSWLIESLNIDKLIPSWTYCLVTYGDVYIRFFRKSDYEDDLLFGKNQKNQLLNESKKNIQLREYKDKYPDIDFTNELDTGVKDQTLNEDVTLKFYSANDPYVPYVEMVPNPAEVFDLQKFGKTYGYIKASTRVIQTSTDEMYQYLTKYKMNQNEVEIYDAMTFAHGYLPSTTQRQPETVDIYLEHYVQDKKSTLASNGDLDNPLLNRDLSVNEKAAICSYNVKRGQSILYNSFRIWRELNLLEMSALLNRLTRSSLVRIINVQVPDMPREQIRGYIQRLKDKIEQKSALAEGKSFQNYTNSGPIENTIYIPTFGEKGSLSIQSLGGDFDPKSLVDLEYFRDKLFGNLKVPKQFFGFTDDGAGFNGGASLTIISSRYGKTIKKIQNVLCQLVTDIVNLFLIDRGLDTYVNKFRIRMQPPVTQEEIDRRQNTDNRVRYISDIMGQLSGLIEDKTVLLKLYKALSSQVINDTEVLSELQNYIAKLEAQQEQQKSTPEKDSSDNFGGGASTGGFEENNLGDIGGLDLGGEENTPEPELAPEPTQEESSELPSPAEVLPNESFYLNSDKDLLVEDEGGQDSYLPTPNELGL